MLRAVIAGERNPKVLAEMARGVMRRKIARLEEALDCSFFTPEHAFILQMMLDNIDHYTAQIAVLDKRIAVLCEPYERQIAQLDGIPGFGVTAAQDLIAEIGVDMSAFPTAGHLASWARVAPRDQESAASARERAPPAEATPTSALHLGEASASACRTQTFLGAKLRRLGRHMPKKKAQGAVMRTQLAIAHGLLADPAAAYRELGPGYYEQKAGTRHARGHVRSLERLGYKVTIEPLTAPTPKPTRSPPAPPASRTPPQPARRCAPGSRRHKPPPALKACPAKVLFSDQRRQLRADQPVLRAGGVGRELSVCASAPKLWPEGEVFAYACFIVRETSPYVPSAIVRTRSAQPGSSACGRTLQAILTLLTESGLWVSQCHLLDRGVTNLNRSGTLRAGY